MESKVRCVALKRQRPRHHYFNRSWPTTVTIAEPPLLRNLAIGRAFTLADPQSSHRFGFLFHLLASGFELLYLRPLSKFGFLFRVKLTVFVEEFGLLHFSMVSKAPSPSAPPWSDFTSPSVLVSADLLVLVPLLSNCFWSSFSGALS